MATSPPLLKESQVRALATEQSFERGENYYLGGAIFNPMRQGNTLWADCEGSTTYQPRVTLGAQGVEAESCTCPYDWGGLCKHQVALLLTYVRDRDRFHELQPTAQLLAQRSRDELLTLIERMVQRHPDLLDMVEAPAAPAAGQAPDLDNYRRAVERVFQGADMKTMAAALEALAEHGKQCGQRGNWANAGDVYQLLLETANDRYGYTVLDIDYNGEVGCVIQDIAQGLSDSLAQAEHLDVGRHQLWIETFFAAVLKDVQLGGMDYAYPAWDTLIAHSTDEDWQWVEAQVRQGIQKSGQSSLGEWGREALVKLLLDRANRRGQTAVADGLVLELGTPRQQAFHHLHQGNFEAALALARSHFKSLPGLVIQFADALLAQAPDLAVEFMQECNAKSDYGYQAWLANFFKTHGQPEKFIAVQVDLLKTRFSLQDYQDLQAQAEPLGQWPTLRQQLLADLQDKKQVSALLDIALLEQDSPSALGYLKQLPYFHQKTYQVRVAEAIGGDRPEDAIALYQELVETAIKQRGRDNYRQAAHHLKAIQRLSSVTQREKAFFQYVQQLRDRNNTLRALKEELDRAGL